MSLATLFVHPIIIPWDMQLWLLLPLLAAVAIIYKAVRTHHVRRLGIEAGFTFLYMVGGILALSAVLWLLTEYWP